MATEGRTREDLARDLRTHVALRGTRETEDRQRSDRRGKEGPRGVRREAKRSKGARIREARNLCGSQRKLVAKRRVERRKRLLRELREVTRQEKAAAKERCDLGKRRAHDSVQSDVTKRQHALLQERAYQADLKRIEANNRNQQRTIRRASKSERREENEGEVAGNIPPELVPLWEKVKRSIKGSSRQSRTEAFMQYAHENPREVVEAQEGDIDAAICELEHRQNEGRRFCKRKRFTPAELASSAVPF